MLLVCFSTEFNFQINKTNLIYFRCDGKILQMSTFSSLIRHFRPIVPIVASTSCRKSSRVKCSTILWATHSRQSLARLMTSSTVAMVSLLWYKKENLKHFPSSIARHRIRNAAELDRSDRRTLSTCWTDLSNAV